MMKVPGEWRKSSFSGGNNECVELRWRKSSRSAQQTNCVEVSNLDAVRDSKNPAAGVLRVQLPGFLAAVKTGRFDR